MITSINPNKLEKNKWSGKQRIRMKSTQKKTQKIYNLILMQPKKRLRTRSSLVTATIKFKLSNKRVAMKVMQKVSQQLVKKRNSGILKRKMTAKNFSEKLPTLVKSKQILDSSLKRKLPSNMIPKLTMPRMDISKSNSKLSSHTRRPKPLLKSPNNKLSNHINSLSQTQPNCLNRISWDRDYSINSSNIHLWEVCNNNGPLNSNRLCFNSSSGNSNCCNNTSTSYYLCNNN